jgi:hypothetical protein
MNEAPGREDTVSRDATVSDWRLSEGGFAAGGSAGRRGSAPVSPVPQLSLPKGGGAVRGIGERFAVNPATGAATFTVPIATRPGPGPEDLLPYHPAR